MNLKRRIGSIPIILLLIMLQVATRAEVSAAELQDAYKWFDTLGYPSFDRLPFARVSTGEPSSRDKRYKSRRVGFLMNESKSAFTVYFPDLTIETYAKSAITDSTRIGYDKLDIAEWTNNWLSICGNSQEAQEKMWADFDGDTGPGVAFYTIAHALAARGQMALSIKVCSQIHFIFVLNKAKRKVTFRDNICQQMARGYMIAAINRFSDPKIGRESLLAPFQVIVRRFPDSTFGPQASETVQTLGGMLQEDKRHAPHPLEKLDNLTDSERVKELIFRLHDQPPSAGLIGGPVLFSLFPGYAASPAGRLVMMSGKAVPQLIGALSDERFIRAVYQPRGVHGMPRVIRVSDIAKSILEQISGRSFAQQDDYWPRNGMTSDARMFDILYEVNAWWKEYQKKGELGTLVEGVSRGDRESMNQAYLLAKRYPNSAASAICAGLNNSSECWVSNRLFYSMPGVNGATAIEAARDQLQHSRSVASRIEAAWILRNDSNAGATPAMLQEWRSYVGNRPRYGETDVDLIDFLATSEDPSVVLALGENLAGKPTDLRTEIIVELAKPDASFLGGPIIDYSHGAPAARPALQTGDAVEAVLARELLDTDKRTSITIPLPDCPRLCDASALALSQRFPDRYRYSDGANLEKRDSERLRLYNVWLKASGRPAVMALPKPHITQLSTPLPHP